MISNRNDFYFSTKIQKHLYSKDSKKLFETLSWKIYFGWIHELGQIKMCKFQDLKHIKCEIFDFSLSERIFYDFI